MIWSGAKIPRVGDAAKPYTAKWTLTTEGQRKYGGWKDGAYDAYENYCDFVQKNRELDASTDNSFQKHCLKIVRELHKIPDNELEEVGGKKRKAKPTPPPADPTKRRVRSRTRE